MYLVTNTTVPQLPFYFRLENCANVLKHGYEKQRVEDTFSSFPFEAHKTK